MKAYGSSQDDPCEHGRRDGGGQRELHLQDAAEREGGVYPRHDRALRCKGGRGEHDWNNLGGAAEWLKVNAHAVL